MFLFYLLFLWKSDLRISAINEAMKKLCIAIFARRITKIMLIVPLKTTLKNVYISQYTCVTRDKQISVFVYNNSWTSANILCIAMYRNISLLKKAQKFSWFKLNCVWKINVQGEIIWNIISFFADKCLGGWKNRSLRLFTRLLGAEKLFSPRHIIFKRSEHWLTEVFQKNFLHSLLSPVRHIFQLLRLAQLTGQLVSFIPGT